MEDKVQLTVRQLEEMIIDDAAKELAAQHLADHGENIYIFQHNTTLQENTLQDTILQDTILQENTLQDKILQDESLQDESQQDTTQSDDEQNVYYFRVPDTVLKDQDRKLYDKRRTEGKTQRVEKIQCYFYNELDPYDTFFPTVDLLLRENYHDQQAIRDTYALIAPGPIPQPFVLRGQRHDSYQISGYKKVYVFEGPQGEYYEFVPHKQALMKRADNLQNYLHGQYVDDDRLAVRVQYPIDTIELQKRLYVEDNIPYVEQYRCKHLNYSFIFKAFVYDVHILIKIMQDKARAYISENLDFLAIAVSEHKVGETYHPVFFESITNKTIMINFDHQQVYIVSQKNTPMPFNWYTHDLWKRLPCDKIFQDTVVNDAARTYVQNYKMFHKFEKQKLLRISLMETAHQLEHTLYPVFPILITEKAVGSYIQTFPKGIFVTIDEKVHTPLQIYAQRLQNVIFPKPILLGAWIKLHNPIFVFHGMNYILEIQPTYQQAAVYYANFIDYVTKCPKKHQYGNKQKQFLNIHQEMLYGKEAMHCVAELPHLLNRICAPYYKQFRK